jgi:hypothetical protein
MPFPTDRRLASLVAALLLAGCAQPVPPPAPAVAPAAAPPPPPVVIVEPGPPLPPPPEDLAARRLLAWHERLRTLPAADLAREQARLQNPAGPAEVLELALLLGQVRAPGDLQRALALLDPLVRDNGSPLTPLARLLQSRLAEQRRLEELAERQAQQIRDQQRRIEQLGQQIEQLRAIERSLGSRPAASAPPPR